MHSGIMACEVGKDGRGNNADHENKNTRPIIDQISQWNLGVVFPLIKIVDVKGKHDLQRSTVVNTSFASVDSLGTPYGIRPLRGVSKSATLQPDI